MIIDLVSFGGNLEFLIIFFLSLAGVCSVSYASVPAEHRFCINLLKAYGTLNAVLLVSDLISFGAILSQVRAISSAAVAAVAVWSFCVFLIPILHIFVRFLDHTFLGCFVFNCSQLCLFLFHFSGWKPVNLPF